MLHKCCEVYTRHSSCWPASQMTARVTDVSQWMAPLLHQRKARTCISQALWDCLCIVPHSVSYIMGGNFPPPFQTMQLLFTYKHLCIILCLFLW